MVDFFNPAGRGTGMKGSISAANSLFDGIEQRKINAMKLMGVEDSQRRGAMTEDAKTAELLIRNGDNSGAMEFLSERAQESSMSGGNPRETMEVYEALRAGDTDSALGMIDNYRSIFDDSYAKNEDGDSSETSSFKYLTEGLTPEQVKRAKTIKLGLTSRSVGSSAQTIANEEGQSEKVGESQAIIAQRKKFGELTGSSRSKAIDGGYSKIERIKGMNAKYARAVELIDSGAKSGKIQSLLPSLTAASVELDQLTNTLALDVISGVTLGAISAPELKLVKAVGLPLGLEGPALKDWLIEKQAAQNKLADYLYEQIDFLDTGGTVAGFVRMKRREMEQPQAKSDTAADEALMNKYL